MYGLLIKQPHLEKILSNKAKFDRRMFRTQKRGRIALVDPSDDSIKGFTEIIVVKPCSYRDYLDQYDEHSPTADQWAAHRNYYEIQFGKTERLDTPIRIPIGELDTVWVEIPEYLAANKSQKSLFDF